jgi:hypothetical protein
VTCRDCIDEGTATGGPCTEPRHQAGVADVIAWSGPPDTDAAGCRHEDVTPAGTLLRGVPSTWDSPLYEFPPGAVTVIVGDCACRAVMYRVEIATGARRIRTRWIAEEPTGERGELSGPPSAQDYGEILAAAVSAAVEERDRARRWAVALEQECARLADQVRVLTATVSALCDATGLDPAIVADVVGVAAAAAEATTEGVVAP